MLPLSLVRPALEAGTVCRFQVPGVQFVRRFRLLHHQNKYLTRPMRAMIQLCEDAWA